MPCSSPTTRRQLALCRRFGQPIWLVKHTSKACARSRGESSGGTWCPARKVDKFGNTIDIGGDDRYACSQQFRSKMPANSARDRMAADVAHDLDKAVHVHAVSIRPK